MMGTTTLCALSPVVSQSEKESHQVLNIYQEVTDLLSYLTQPHHATYGFGTVNCNSYDTAWVAMVAKAGEDAIPRWTFPECFQALLNSQCNDGGWDRDGVEFDRIASTLASLLALKRHLNTEGDEIKREAWNQRVSQASGFLNKRLPKLRNDSGTDAGLAIGAELWLPTLLQLLEKEGVRLETHELLSWLLPIRDEKLAKFPIDVLHRSTKVTPAHSLEGFIDVADFSKVIPQMSFGSMMGSPSSTAAYLIHSPTWDHEAEEYLRHVICAGSGRQSGRIPTTFPTTVFELAWGAVNILSNHLNFDNNTDSMLQLIGGKLQSILERQEGMMGFAQDMCGDADDTAKTLIALHLLGIHTSLDAFITRFECEDYFCTFEHERNPSVSTNAHVLLALLQYSQDKQYLPQIDKCVRYLCDEWSNSDGLIQDKWNVSPYYPTMLVCDGLVKYISRWDDQDVSPGDDVIKSRIFLVLYQAMVRIIRTQNADGSWGPRQSLEETAYALLALKKLLTIPFEPTLRNQATGAVDRGCQYLHDEYDHSFERDRLWVDKTLYSIETVAKSYILGALGAKVPSPIASQQVCAMFEPKEYQVRKMATLLARLPTFASTPEWVIQSSVRESFAFVHELHRFDFFAQRDVIKDGYLLYISSLFVASNNKDPYFLSANYLLVLLEVTVATYHLDNFVDSFMMELPDERLDTIQQFILDQIHDLPIQPETSSSATPILGNIPVHLNLQGYDTKTQNGHDLEQVKHQLVEFIQFMVSPGRGKAGDYDRRNLENELESALMAQIKHIKNSRQMRSARASSTREVGLRSNPDNQTFYAWLQGCGTDHVLFPVIFKYVIHKLAHDEEDVFPTAREKFIAEDYCRQSAAEIRLWNDYGGVLRDRQEGVLNSVDFCEYYFSGKIGEERDKEALQILAQLARYQHRYVTMCLDELDPLMHRPHQQKIVSRLRMFQIVIDVFGEMYAKFQFSVSSVPG